MRVTTNKPSFARMARVNAIVKRVIMAFLAADGARFKRVALRRPYFFTNRPRSVSLPSFRCHVISAMRQSCLSLTRS